MNRNILLQAGLPWKRKTDCIYCTEKTSKIPTQRNIGNYIRKASNRILDSWETQKEGQLCTNDTRHTLFSCTLSIGQSVYTQLLLDALCAKFPDSRKVCRWRKIANFWILTMDAQSFYYLPFYSIFLCSKNGGIFEIGFVAGFFLVNVFRISFRILSGTYMRKTSWCGSL